MVMTMFSWIEVIRIEARLGDASFGVARELRVLCLCWSSPLLGSIDIVFSRTLF